LGRIPNLEIALRQIGERQSGGGRLRRGARIQHVIALWIAKYQGGARYRTAYRNAERPIRRDSDVARDADRLSAGDIHRRPGLVVVDRGDLPSAREVFANDSAVRELLAGSKRQFVGIARHQALWRVIPAQCLVETSIIRVAGGRAAVA